MKLDSISQAHEELHDPLLARISALGVLPSGQRMKWLDERSAALRAARRAAKRTSFERYSEAATSADVAILDAQLRCLSELRRRLSTDKS